MLKRSGNGVVASFLRYWSFNLNRYEQKNWMARLNPDQINGYQRDGVLFPIPVLTEDDISDFLDGLAVVERRLGGKPKSEELCRLCDHFAWAFDLATHPKVLDAVENILGPDILVWGTDVFTKYPRDPGFISWHQDGTYWELNSDQVTTAWIALTESSVENGCMRVVRGSQTLPIQPHVDTYAEDNGLSRGQEIAVDVSDDEATDVVLMPGQMSLHHVNIVHGSRANASDKKRVGFVVRYITPEVKPGGAQAPVILARGEDRNRHFEHKRRPSDIVDLDRAMESHLRTAREFLSSIRQTKGAYQNDAE